VRTLILVFIISLIGCSNAHSSDGASELHDDEKHVTCYVLSGYQLGGIYCIPDSQLNSKGN